MGLRPECIRRGNNLTLAALVVAAALVSAGCETVQGNVALGTAGATLLGARTPANEIEQTYYLGVFDPQEQVPPTVYRVRVRGQASAISGMKFASGWVQANVIDSLGTHIEFNKDSAKVEINKEDPNDLVSLQTGRRLMLFDPEGYREAPKDHRLVIVMGASPEKYFKAVDKSLSVVSQAVFKHESSRELFIAEVTRVANAFLEARDELRKVMRVTLAALAYRDDGTKPLPEQRQRAKEYAIELATLTLKADNFCEAAEDISKSACNGIREPGDSVVESLKKLVCCCKRGETPEKAIGEALQNDTADTAVALLEADKYLAESNSPSADKPKVQFMYGLAHGPVFDTNELGFAGGSVANMSRLCTQIASGYAQGFEGGRLDEGITSLIDDYLKTRDLNDTAQSAPAVKARERLVLELVHFAEKVLLLADNAPLLKESPLAEGGAQTLAREQSKHMRVLQSVGNSMLVQADELQHRATHDRQLVAAKGREARALIKAGHSDPLEVLSGLVADLSAEKAGLVGEIASLNKERTAQVDKRDALKAKAPTAPTPAPAPSGVQAADDAAADKAAKDADENKKIQDQIGELNKKIAELDSRLKVASDRDQRLSRVLPVVAEAKSAVEKDMAGKEPWPSGPQAYAMVNAQLNQMLASSADKPLVREAIEEVEKLGPPKDYDFSGVEEARTAKDVLDEIVATLREEHIRAVRDHGADSPEAARIAAAIQAAYAHRSGMVYIRPASAYLRMSYAATTLQQKPNIGWENMLEGHLIRNLPIIGPCIENTVQGNLSPSNKKITYEIDKQYWQTINSVRVSGFGNTNYVIVKDDIGNWYVKGYSADPEPVIEGAQSLAMFSLGGALHTDLLAGIKTGVVPTTASQAETSRAPFVKLLRKYEADYMADANKSLEDLASLLKGTAKDDKYTCPLTTQISDAWKTIAVVSEDSDLFGNLQSALGKAANAQLSAASNALGGTVKNAEDLSAKAQTLAEALKKTSTPDLSKLLDPIIGKVANPARVNLIAGLLAQGIEKKGAEALVSQIEDLKQDTTVKEPSAKIIEGLQAVRRFYDGLVVLLANVDFTAKAKEALSNAKDDPAKDQGNADPQEAGDEADAKVKAYQDASKAVRATAKDIVRAKLDEFIDKRVASVDAYKRALLFASEANSQQ